LRLSTPTRTGQEYQFLLNFLIITLKTEGICISLIKFLTIPPKKVNYFLKKEIICIFLIFIVAGEIRPVRITGAETYDLFAENI